LLKQYLWHTWVDEHQKGQKMEAEVQKAFEDLKNEIRELKQKGAKKELDSDLALAALMPLFGMTPFCGTSLFLPFGLRLAAARALVLHRALNRAATISKALAKVGDEDGLDVEDLVEKFFKGIAGVPEADRQKLAAKLRDIIWKKNN
jgi:hypothetical protein